MTAASVGDSRFFARSGPHTVAAVAAACGAAVGGSPVDGSAVDGSAVGGAGAAARLLHGVAPLQAAGPLQVSFLDNRRYAALLDTTAAGAVIVHPDMAGRVPATAVALVTPEPYLGWARAAALFHPPPPPRPGIHPAAVVDPAARIDPSAEIGPLAVVEAGAEIAAGCRIGAGAVIGAGVVLGAGTRIGANATVSHALIGARVFVFPGVRIGQEGFGFAITATGFVTVPQLGRVIVEDDAEIGANCTIDRGAGQDTVIGAGSRLDNLVQIGHNVRLGRCCVIVAQVGVSGSTVLDDFVMVGGQAGLAGHLHVGRRARIAAQAGVISDVAAGVEVIGSPALPAREFWRSIAVLRKLTASWHALSHKQQTTRTGHPQAGDAPDQETAQRTQSG